MEPGVLGKKSMYAGSRHPNAQQINISSLPHRFGYDNELLLVCGLRSKHQNVNTT